MRQIESIGRKKLHVLISLDVEEEGLFGGSYKRENVPLKNIELLPELVPLVSSLGYKLTLFCAWSVFNSPKAREILQFMQSKTGCEIGAHLHHWSTPPFQDEFYMQNSQPMRTHLLPERVFREKLETLLNSAEKFLNQPITSFRMGRWDLKNAIFPILAEYGIKVDSSICPLRAFANGANHFLAPVNPYWVDCGKYGKILEAPITQLPVSHKFARLWQKISGARYLDLFHFFGAISANPLWHGNIAMRLATRLHAYNNGFLLNFFWHSSEMMPGGSPKIPDRKASQKLLQKIYNFCEWLTKIFNVVPVTASDLFPLASDMKLETFSPSQERDW